MTILKDFPLRYCRKHVHNWEKISDVSLCKLWCIKISILSNKTLVGASVSYGHKSSLSMFYRFEVNFNLAGESPTL